MLQGVLIVVGLSIIIVQALVIYLLVELVNKERAVKRAERRQARNFIKALAKAYTEENVDKEDFEDAYNECYVEYVNVVKSRKELQIKYDELKDAYQVLCENVFDYINQDAKENEAFSDEFKNLDTSKVIQLFNIKAI